MTPDLLAPLRALMTANADTLKKLSVAGAKEALDDVTVVHIVKTLQHLEELDISDCGSLKGGSVEAVVKHAANLRILSTSRCYGVPIMSYLDLVRCPRLEEFNAFGIIKENSLNEMRSRLQGIQVNLNLFTHIARPTVGAKRTSIWNMRTRQTKNLQNN